MKCISRSQSPYKLGIEDRAVDRRAAEFHQEYVVKVRGVEQKFVGYSLRLLG